MVKTSVKFHKNLSKTVGGVAPTRYPLSIHFHCQKKKLKNQRTIGPENAHLKPDLGVLSHNEMTLTFIDFISCLHLQSFWSQAAIVSKPSDF